MKIREHMRNVITEGRRPGPRGAIAEWTITLALVFFGTSTLVHAYVIPTGWMEETILIGDHLLRSFHSTLVVFHSIEAYSSDLSSCLSSSYVNTIPCPPSRAIEWGFARSHDLIAGKASDTIFALIW